MSEFKGLERSCNKDVFTLKQKNMLEQVSNDYPSLLNHFRRAHRGVSRKSAIQAKNLQAINALMEELRTHGIETSLKKFNW